MFLPIRLFLDYTDVKYTWDQQDQMLHITDERAATGQAFQDFAGNDFTKGNLDRAFQLTSYRMNPYSLSITARNISGGTIAKGKADIHSLVEFKNNGGFSTDSYTKPTYPDPPEVTKDEFITITQRFDIQNAAYIIAVGRQENLRV